MKKIVLISDTHSFLGSDVKEYLGNADEIWHAGDIGDPKVAEELETYGLFRTVYGNIDGKDIRHRYPLNESFKCEGVKIFMTHIGGYPGRYTKRVKELLIKEKPDLYICGHSHICKVVRDNQLGLLHMNPGACGIEGFHKFRTMLRFECSKGEIGNLELIELGLKWEAPNS